MSYKDFMRQKLIQELQDALEEICKMYDDFDILSDYLDKVKKDLENLNGAD